MKSLERIILLQNNIKRLEKEINLKKKELEKYKICYCGNALKEDEAQCFRCQDAYGSPPAN